MPAGVEHFSDPGIQYGALRVLPRTDGFWIVYDVRRPIGKRTVGKPFPSMKAADFAAKNWAAQGHAKLETE